MAHKICKHGELLKLDGGGYYFLCRYDAWEKSEEWRQGSQCRYAKWYQEEKKYYASTDDGGNMCPHFSLLRPKVIESAPSITKSVETEDDNMDAKEENTVNVFKSLFSELDEQEKDEDIKEKEGKEKPSRRKSK
jgi:hypothetical protein